MGDSWPHHSLSATTSYPANKAKQLHVWLLPSGEAPRPPARSSAPHPSISATHLHSPAQAQPTAFPDGSHCLGPCYFPQGVSLLALFPQTAALSSALLSVFSAHPWTAHSSPCPASLACHGFPDKRPGFLTKGQVSHHHLFSPYFVPKPGHSSLPLSVLPFPQAGFPHSRRSSSRQNWQGLQVGDCPDRDELRGTLV